MSPVQLSNCELVAPPDGWLCSAYIPRRHLRREPARRPRRHLLRGVAPDFECPECPAYEWPDLDTPWASGGGSND
jgi:hypothetical protein